MRDVYKRQDQVRPGGVVAFVTSRYTMDAKDSTVRRYLAPVSYTHLDVYKRQVVLEDDGQYANFKLEFDQRKGGSR